MKNKAKKLIALYEMIGGIIWIFIFLAWGISSIVRTVVNTTNLINTSIIILAFIIMIVLYVMTFIAGISLWDGNPKGSFLSIIVQAFQIPYIVIPGITYTFISGLQLGAGITITPSNFGIRGLAYLGSSSNIYFARIPKYVILGINFIPIIIIAYLKKSKKVEKSSELNLEYKFQINPDNTSNNENID